LAIEYIRDWCDSAAGFAQQHPHLTIFFAVGSALIAAVIVAAARSIVGEYAKRFWFQKVWKDEVQKLRAERDELSRTLANQAVAHAAERDILMSAVLERNDLRQKLARLGADKANLTR
jgi:hypothetical protein